MSIPGHSGVANQSIFIYRNDVCINLYTITIIYKKEINKNNNKKRERKYYNVIAMIIYM